MSLNKKTIKIRFGKPELKGMLLGCCLFLIGVTISVLRYQILIQYERQHLNTVLDLIEQNIERTIQESYNSALTLALTVNAESEVVNFERVAKQILKNTTSVDVLELVPDGIITYVYPLEGNESVVGYDILSDPNVNAEVLKAAELGTIYFAGPFELRQGGMAVVGRIPIIVNDEIWGYSAVVLYLETLIENSGINTFPEETYYFQLAKINPNTNVEEFFLPIRQGVELGTFESVRFPEGNWRLYATRVGNNIPFNTLLSILIASLLGSIILGMLSTKLFRKPLDLEELLQEKSNELLQSREKYKLNSELMESIFKSPKSMIIFSLDLDYKYLAFSISHKEIMKNLLGVDIKKGMNMLEIIPNEKSRRILKTDFDRAFKGEHFDYIREFKNKNGDPAFWENRFAPILSKNGTIVGLTAFVANIDKRVMAEREIMLEKSLSDSIINSLPGIFYLYNKEGKFLRWNKNFETVTGYSAKEMESVHPLDFFVDDEKELLKQKIENVFISGEDNVEANFVSKDGSKVPFYFTGASINYKGEECLLGVGINISEQKEAEKKHQQVLLQLQTHLNNSPLGVVEYDKNLDITQWSKRCDDIFGWSEEEIIGKNAFDLIYEEDQGKTKVIANELSGGNVDWNVSFNRNHTKSGKVIDCIWYNTVIKNDDSTVNAVMSLVEDITERKRAEEKLKQSEYRYRTLVKNSPYCIHEINLEGKLISMNQAGLDMLSIENEETVIGKTYLESVSKKDKDKVTTLLQRALNGIESEFEFESSTGSYFYSSFVPIVDKDKKVQRLMGITQDITERKKAEEMIENSLKEKTTLLSEIHHRVKNNLAIVSGLLQLQSYEMDDERVSFAFDQSINRIISIAMVHELMYKSTDLTSINIHTYLENLIPAITATMKDETKNVSFEIDIEDYKMNINEAIPLGLLLNELFTNSFKYAFRGRKEGVIKVLLGAHNDYLKVTYEDDGVGFDSGIDFNKPKNLGLNLIHSQLQQLDATFSAETESKFKLEFTFPPNKTGSHATYNVGVK
tara:strand:+ start:31956 stop:35024 length:3069 start_codon:yes stop_codon:yes gene_type:complete